MADFVVKDPPEYNQALRKLETTDPNHADVFNALFGQLVNNDAFLAALARGTARVLEGHRDNGDIHVSTQEKQGWDAKAGTAVATQGAAGLMGAADKKKLDGVAEGAEANQNAYSNVRVGDATVTANGKTAALVLEAGANITLAADNAAKKVTIAAQRDGGNADTLDGYHAAHFAASSEVEGLKKSVSDGKRSVAAAVTAKGVTTAADATFAAIAANIGKISTGVDTSDATAAAGDALGGKTFYAGGKKVTGSMPSFVSMDSESRNVVTAQESLSMGAVGVGSGRPIRTIASPTVIKTSGGNYVAGAYVNDEERNLYIPKANGQFIAGFPQSAVASAIGLTADKLVGGNTILGIAGTGGGGKDVTVSGTTTSMTPVKVNLSDYGITDYNVLVIQVVDQIARKGIPGTPDKVFQTYYENMIIIKNGDVFFLLGNANNLATFNNSFPLNSNISLGISFTGNAFYRSSNALSALPKSVGVGKYTNYYAGPYETGSNICEYTTRIIAF